MINSVKKISESTYNVNDVIIVHNFNDDGDNITYSVDYDPIIISKNEAIELASEFLNSSLKEYISSRFLL